MSGPRRYRRRGPVFVECTDRLWLDPMRLLRGELAPQRLPLVRAHAPPRAQPVEIDLLAATCLAALCEGQATELPEMLRAMPGVEAALCSLLDHELIESVDADDAGRVAALDATVLHDWDGPGALYHFSSRWSGVVARDDVPVDVDGAARAWQASRAAFEQQTDARGTPPTHRPERGGIDAALALPRPPQSAFDELLRARETHRAFDTSRAIRLDQLASLLQRCFGELGQIDLGGGLTALRKRVPSGGGMHPVEAYPLIVDVEGVAPGWYHYRAGDHALAPVKSLPRDAARGRIERLAAGQRYFAGAPLVVALTLRFPRHHWKYARHARAYRVMLMETGHVGQTFYLAATELGLGAFFTAAINDADVDAELGLDGIEEGCVALVGCGVPTCDGASMRLSHYVDAG
jgi:putative peptide maturation dehydrogenase